MPKLAARKKIRLGIVGSEAAKFTPESEAKARAIIRQLIANASEVVSGECHLGGIDIWAKEEAIAAGIPFKGFAPACLAWTNGYKPRNLEIAQRSDKVVCITIDKLPDGYDGMRFPLCYHCKTDTHVKSGGCWTVLQALKMGKQGEIIVIRTET